ncbi:putative HAT dimerization domain-containing protein [Helianthus annuus]|nr:putative HAT dimerization domain-containing protein [Helianthus annuus]
MSQKPARRTILVNRRIKPPHPSSSAHKLHRKVVSRSSNKKSKFIKRCNSEPTLLTSRISIADVGAGVGDDQRYITPPGDSSLLFMSRISTNIYSSSPELLPNSPDQIEFYHKDFTDKEITELRRQLELFNVKLSKNIRLSSVSTLSDLCKTLVKTNKREEYALVDRVVRLILTLPVSTATTEQRFSAMKIFKNCLRNKMADEYLTNSLVIYIEKEIADKFDSEDIIHEFKNLKGRRAKL